MNLPEAEDQLTKTLANWVVAPRRDPAFRASVWSRIEALPRPTSWPGYARAHAGVLAGAMAVALVIGGWVGREQARSRVEADRMEIVAAYVQALDARSMTMP